jgi:hypothetical protein
MEYSVSKHFKISEYINTLNMGAAMSSAWFFISPIPDISNKGKPKQVSSFIMCVSFLCSLMMLRAGYLFYSVHPGFPVPFPPSFFPGMLLLCCSSCCSSLKLTGQARKAVSQK